LDIIPLFVVLIYLKENSHDEWHYLIIKTLNQKQCCSNQLICTLFDANE